MQFDINAAAALLGYITLIVGFAVLGSSALAFIQTVPSRLRHRNEPVKDRVRRVDPMHVSFDLGGDGTITDLIETDDDGHIVAEYHQKPPRYDAAWLPEEDHGG